jgi:hypothetical protein
MSTPTSSGSVLPANGPRNSWEAAFIQPCDTPIKAEVSFTKDLK